MAGTLYILNTLIVPINFDIHQNVKISFKRISLEEAKKLIHESEKIESAIGHSATAELLSILFETEIPCERKTVFMIPGDCGLHFFLKQRLPEGTVLSQQELEKLDFWLVLSEVEQEK